MELKNTSLGFDNLSQVNQTVNESAQLNISEAISRSTSALGGQIVGSRPLIGILILLAMTFGLWKGEAGLDASAGIMIPTIMFLATEGFLPFAAGINYAVILGVSGFLAWGVIKFIT